MHFPPISIHSPLPLTAQPYDFLFTPTFLYFLPFLSYFLEELMISHAFLFFYTASLITSSSKLSSCPYPTQTKPFLLSSSLLFYATRKIPILNAFKDLN